MSDAPKAVFLSYAREDTEAARRIADALRSQAVEVWFDQSELRGGDTWDARIRKQINDCTLFLPIISAHTQERNKGYFRLEWKLAVEQTHLMLEGVPFLAPVVIDDTTESGAAVPAEFMRVQWTRLPGALPSPQFVEQVKRLMSMEQGAGSKEQSRERRTEVKLAPRKSGLPGWTWGALTVVVVGVGAYFALRPAHVGPVSDRPHAEPARSPAPVTPAPSLSPSLSLAPPKADAKSIAVLPFENRSEDKASAYFTDGIHDDLITQISRIRDIKTISRTSVMIYKGTTKNMRTIGAELGVATLLEGGVQRAGSQVRINVQLIAAATDAHLWAETYTRELTAENIFAIQSEIAGAIAKALQAVLSPAEQDRLDKLPTKNLAALEAFFKGKESWALGTVPGCEQAVLHFEKAIALDPAFALAHATLGQTQLNQIWLAGLSSGQQIAKAEPHILRAVALDATLSEAYAALGVLRQNQYDAKAAEIAFKKAIELNPNNAEAYSAYANFLEYTVGDAQGAARVLRKSVELDPNSESAQNRLAESLVLTDQLDEARRLLEANAAKNPDRAWAQFSLGRFYAQSLGRYDDAIVALRKAHALDPISPTGPQEIAGAYENLGDTEQAVRWYERTEKIAPDSLNQATMRMWKSKIAGDEAKAEEYALAGLREHPKNGFLLWQLLTIDLASGHPEKSRVRYQSAYPYLFKPAATVYVGNAWMAKDVARLLIATGDREQANELITATLAASRSMPSKQESALLEAMLRAIAGDKPPALAALRRYQEAGGTPGRLRSQDELKPLHDHPEYQAMIAGEQARVAAQLTRIRRLEANGELAPIPPLPVLPAKP